MSKATDALNGAKARIVTITRTCNALEEENTLLRHRCAVADKRHESTVSRLIDAENALDNSRAIRVQISKKLENARCMAVALGLLLVITLGTVAGGIFH